MQRDYLSDEFTAKEREAEYTRNVMNLQLATVSNRANAAKAMLQKFPKYTIPRTYQVTASNGSVRNFHRAHNTFDTRWDETVGSYIPDKGNKMTFWLSMSGQLASTAYERYIIENYFMYRIMALYAELAMIPKFVFAVDTNDSIVRTEEVEIKSPTKLVDVNGYEVEVLSNSETPKKVVQPKKYYKRIGTEVKKDTVYDPSEYYYKWSASGGFIRAVPDPDTHLYLDSSDNLSKFRQLNGADKFFVVKFREYKPSASSAMYGTERRFELNNRYYIFDVDKDDYVELMMRRVWNPSTQSYTHCVLTEESEVLAEGKQIYRDLKMTPSPDLLNPSQVLVMRPGIEYEENKIVVDAGCNGTEIDATSREVIELIIKRYNYILDLLLPLLKLLRKKAPVDEEGKPISKILMKEYTVKDLSYYLWKFMKWINADRIERGGSPMTYKFDPYDYTVYELKRGINAIITSFTEDTSGLTSYLARLANSWYQLLGYTSYKWGNLDPDKRSIHRIVKAFLVDIAEQIQKFVFAVPSKDTTVNYCRVVQTRRDIGHALAATEDDVDFGYIYPLKTYCTRKYIVVPNDTLYSEGETYFTKRSDGTFAAIVVPSEALDVRGMFYAQGYTRKFYVVNFIEYKLPVATFTSPSEHALLELDREYFSYNEETGQYTELETTDAYEPVEGYAVANGSYFVWHHDGDENWYEEVRPEVGTDLTGLYIRKKALVNTSFVGTVYASLKYGDPLPEGIETDSPDEMDDQIQVNEILPLVVSRFNQMMSYYSTLFAILHVESSLYNVSASNYTVRSLMMQMANFIDFRNNWRISAGLTTLNVNIDKNSYTVYNLKKAYNAIVDMYREDVMDFPDVDDAPQDDFVLDPKTVIYREYRTDKIYSYNELGYHFDPAVHEAPDVYDLMELWAHLDFRGADYVMQQFLHLLDFYGAWKKLYEKAAEVGLNSQDIYNLKVVQSIYNRCVYTHTILRFCGYPVIDIAHHLDNVIPISIEKGIQK